MRLRPAAPQGRGWRRAAARLEPGNHPNPVADVTRRAADQRYRAAGEIPLRRSCRRALGPAAPQALRPPPRTARAGGDTIRPRLRGVCMARGLSDLGERLVHLVDPVLGCRLVGRRTLRGRAFSRSTLRRGSLVVGHRLIVRRCPDKGSCGLLQGRVSARVPTAMARGSRQRSPAGTPPPQAPSRATARVLAARRRTRPRCSRRAFARARCRQPRRAASPPR